MTQEEILKFQKRAKHVAIKRGYPECAEDFAQEIFIAFARGWHSTIDQLFIEYLRSEYGNSRTRRGHERRLAKGRTISLDSPIGEEESGTHYHDIIGNPEPDPRDVEVNRGYAFLFTGREAYIYESYFNEQLSEKRIADELSLTESRICQILGSMKKRIKEQAELEQGLERIEWDENYTKLKVDWIKL
jgi:predicted DNA-binding protein YlxM (UPF0122 family)